MSFAAPWFLAAGALAGLAAIALHFLAREEPVRWSFPTARFIPESREQAPSRSYVLRDRLLLLLRVLALAAVALGFARPAWRAARRPLLRVILADLSAAVADTAAVRRMAAELAAPGDSVLVFRHGLSPALVEAFRAARGLRDDADSVAIVLLSPLAREELDAATHALRATWPGAFDWRGVPARDPAPSTALQLRGAADDPLGATVALAGIALREDATVRLVRDAALSASDSTWAAGRDRVLVHWPAGLAGAPDTSGAVVTLQTVLVAAFPRHRVDQPGTPIAWWADGGVAAVERRAGEGCIRQVAIPVDPLGDLALRERLRSLLRELTAPCGGPRDLRPADSATVRVMVGGNHSAVAAASLPPLPGAGRAAAPWLLGAALLLLAAEQLARRGRGAA